MKNSNQNEPSVNREPIKKFERKIVGRVNPP
jgi:hypothetical protein